MSVAFQLREEAGAGPLVFPGFPGVWNQGEPIEAHVFVDAGVAESVDEIADRLPPQLEKVTVDAGSAPLPERPNHVANAEEAIAAAEKALADMTHAELDAKAKALGMEPLPDVVKAEKVALIEAFLTPQDLEELGATTEDEA